MLKEVIKEQEHDDRGLAEVRMLFGESESALAEIKQLFGEICAFLYSNVQQYLNVK